ncbi:MAG TPA: CGGC domain-containing protein [Bacteroidetes bacterium]|nr:CGGC domain-containing protein [Bacteroidota bacterium]
MKKIGIIICHRWHTCGGGKCLRSMREHTGGFSLYPEDEELQLVGYSTCGGCPGGNVEYVPEEMIRNGAEVIHLATGLVVGYPPCPYIMQFKEFIETKYRIPVVLGTHPIPMKYFLVHRQMSQWDQMDWQDEVAHLMNEPDEVKKAYD